MAMVTIMLLAAITFFTRYLFLEGKLPIQLNKNVKKLLGFSAPAVLTAIAAPIIFLRDQQLDMKLTNPYLFAAVLAIFIAHKTRSIYWTVFSGMVTFLLLSWLFKA